MYDAIIIGGGLAGLISSIELSRKGHKVLVIEKYVYPFHRVCGEYLSNEVKPYLRHIGFDVNTFGASNITKVLISSVKGRTVGTDLDLGAFGISRYTMDEKLYHLAETYGVEFRLNTTVEDITKINDTFFVETHNYQSIQTKIVLGTFGKRSKLDKTFDRKFINKKSPFLAIKYHIKTDAVKDTIAIHNFKGGFCGFSAIEDDKYCLCYLSERENLQKSAGIEEMEENILKKNPFLKHIFNNSEFLFNKPLVINEITYEQKSLVEKHILMAGDSAGMIYPITGNGMSIAIRSGLLLANWVTKFLKKEISRQELELSYQNEWEKHYKSKLDRGRKLQYLVGDNFGLDFAIGFFSIFKPALNLLIKTTHGEVMKTTEYS